MQARLDLGFAVAGPMTVALARHGALLDAAPAGLSLPRTRGNFVDSLVAGYTAWTLNHVDGDLIGYCVAMSGVDEMHLLNITVAPTARRRGHARHLLAELVRLCRRSGATRLWLEVRESNAEARDAYSRLGFAPVGRRKGYYPAPEGRREDAVVMSPRTSATANGVPMRWTQRQRAMLREMGIHLWAPGGWRRRLQRMMPSSRRPRRVAPRQAQWSRPPCKSRAERGAAAPAVSLRADATSSGAPAPCRRERDDGAPARSRARRLAGRRRTARRQRSATATAARHPPRAIGVALVAPDRERRAVFCALAAGQASAATRAGDQAALQAAIATVAPRCILAFGKAGAAALLGDDAPLGGLRGRVHAHTAGPVVVTFSLAFLLRHPAEKAKAWADLCLAVGSLTASAA